MPLLMEWVHWIVSGSGFALGWWITNTLLGLIKRS